MFNCLPDSAWADGNLAEAAGQLGKMVEHPNQVQPNSGPQADGTPYTIFTHLAVEGLEDLLLLRLAAVLDHLADEEGCVLALGHGDHLVPQLGEEGVPDVLGTDGHQALNHPADFETGF